MKSKLNNMQEDHNDTKKIYLDYNATTPLAPSVVSRITDALTRLWANPSSKSKSGIEAKESINGARENITTMVNGNDPSEVIFMSGGTEANNHVICSSIKYFKEFYESNDIPLFEKRPHIISSVIEHDSILHVLQVLDKEGIIDVTFVNVSKILGYVDPKEVMSSICDETVLVTIMLANNETGIIQPIREICDKLKSYLFKSRPANLPTIFVHTDAAQAIGKIKVDVQKLGVDYMTIVGHKFYAPRIGALWVRSHCPIYTMLHGGGQENGKRAGTENTCMIVGLGEAAYLVAENIDHYNNNFTSMCKYLKEKLIDTFGKQVIFNNLSEHVLPNTLNISLTGSTLQGQKVLNSCKHLEASVGAACHSHLVEKPSHILLAHGVSHEVAKNAIRLSLGRETTKEDIDVIICDLKSTVETLQPI